MNTPDSCHANHAQNENEPRPEDFEEVRVLISWLKIIYWVAPFFIHKGSICRNGPSRGPI